MFFYLFFYEKMSVAIIAYSIDMKNIDIRDSYRWFHFISEQFAE